MVEEDNQWTLENSMTISRMGSQSASTVTSIATWLKNVGTRRKRKKPGNILSATKKDTLQRTIKGSSQ